MPTHQSVLVLEQNWLDRKLRREGSCMCDNGNDCTSLGPRLPCTGDVKLAYRV